MNTENNIADNDMINIQIPDADFPNAGDKLTTAIRLVDQYQWHIIYDWLLLKDFSQLIPKGSKRTIFDLGPKERFKMIRDVNRSRQSSRRGSYTFSKNGSQRNKNGIRKLDYPSQAVFSVGLKKHPRKRPEFVIPFHNREDRGLEVYVLFALISFLAWFFIIAWE